MTNDFFDRVRFRGKPVADPACQVISGNARFTVLTPRILRLEWSETGAFEDRGSFAFPTRTSQPAPAFTQHVAEGVLVIETASLTLRYKLDSGKFGPGNLSIRTSLNGRPRTWKPGKPNLGNLRGTRRTVDGCEGDAALDEGLFSREGWALFDDSRNVLFNLEDGWVAPRPDFALQDWYFFAFGHDYTGGLAEYMRFGGNMPLIPKFVLGAWWSRYWAYTSQDLKDIANGFEQHDLPLDVFVIDMDWHREGWTGYSWNHDLIPDPDELLHWLRQKNLKIALNLHPADGVGPHEDAYPRFAEEMGVKDGEGVPFHITDKRFAKNYFELLHHPMEAQGVDFWWMDWQQGQRSEMKGLDPLVWLNHLHFEDMARHGKRKIVYSRWGGLGNHRYQTGFSGDTVVGWPALQFQPYYTATSSNVGWGWWAHDIGGHMGNATEPELFARWVQYGALSPTLKLHGTKDTRTERRPWLYPQPTFEASQAAFHWRYQLVPYLYSMARVAADTGVSLCRPMYYTHPESESAYTARFQYWFGDQMIAAPIVFPADKQTGQAAIDVWVPEGEWTDYQTKETFSGPRWVRLSGDLKRVPMLMKPGAILPLAPAFKGPYKQGMQSGNLATQPKDRLVLEVFPGAQGAFRLYEDDGESESYRLGEYEWTPISTDMPDAHTWNVRVGAVEGHCPALPAARSYEVRLQGSRRPVKVLVNGVESKNWRYDSKALCTVIQVAAHDKQQPLLVTALGGRSLLALGKARNSKVQLADAQALLGGLPAGVRDVKAAVQAALAQDCPGRADAVARFGGPAVHFLEFVTPEEAANQLGRAIIAAPSGRGESYDAEVSFTLYDAQGTRQETLVRRGLRREWIVNAPFAFDGTAQTARWEAEVKLTWHGQTLSFTHQSKPLFPSITHLRARVYNARSEKVTLEQALHPTSKRGWKEFGGYDPRTMPNLNHDVRVFLWQDAMEQIAAEKPLAGWVVSKITSPEQCTVSLCFEAQDETPEIYLNGELLAIPEIDPALMVDPWAVATAKTIRGLKLRAGENTLAIATRPNLERRWWRWFFTGKFVDEHGQALTNLKYE